MPSHRVKSQNSRLSFVESGKSLSRLETSQSTPPFFSILFSPAPQNERELALITHYDRRSILRKRVYSFKHSGNSRGEHRGPEKVCSDWQTGHKIGEFVNWQEFGVKFVKISKLKGSRPSGKIERLSLGSLDSRPSYSMIGLTNSSTGFSGTLNERYAPIKPRRTVAELIMSTFAAD